MERALKSNRKLRDKNALLLKEAKKQEAETAQLTALLSAALGQIFFFSFSFLLAEKAQLTLLWSAALGQIFTCLYYSSLLNLLLLLTCLCYCTLLVFAAYHYLCVIVCSTRPDLFLFFYCTLLNLLLIFTFFATALYLSYYYSYTQDYLCV